MRKRIKQINAKMLQLEAKGSQTEAAKCLKQINEIKARIVSLRKRPPGDTYEDAVKWLNIDQATAQEIRARLNKKREEISKATVAIDQFLIKNAGLNTAMIKDQRSQSV